MYVARWVASSSLSDELKFYRGVCDSWLFSVNISLVETRTTPDLVHSQRVVRHTWMHMTATVPLCNTTPAGL